MPAEILREKQLRMTQFKDWEGMSALQQAGRIDLNHDVG
jgi:hypothetical protein